MTNKTGIVAKILALLNLGEEGKIENFFVKQRKALEKDIKNLNKNLDTYEDQKAEALEELNEKLEDAKTKVEDAYTSVTVENVATNEAANSFADTYWYYVANAEAAVEKLETSIKTETEEYDKLLESTKTQIAKKQARLNKIS